MRDDKLIDAKYVLGIENPADLLTKVQPAYKDNLLLKLISKKRTTNTNNTEHDTKDYTSTTADLNPNHNTDFWHNPYPDSPVDLAGVNMEGHRKVGERRKICVKTLYYRGR